MRSSPLALASWVMLAVLVGSGCSRERIDRIYGELAVVHTGADGQTRTDRNATFDYGAVFMGQKVTKKIRVTNLAKGSLTLESLERLEGADPLRINETGAESPVWSVSFPAGKVLGTSEVVELDAVFSPPPPATDEVKQDDHGVALLLRVQNARPGEETATIALFGKAVSGICQLPAVLDFGNVAVQDAYRLSIELRNPTQLPALARIGDIYSNSGTGDHQAFDFAPGSPRGEVELPPGSVRTVEIEFRPTEAKSYLALLRMRASEQCPDQVIQLKGVGVDQVLTWAPAQVDCGYVTPGVEATRSITFTNFGRADAHLSQIGMQNPAEFRIVPTNGTDPTTLVVPGNKGTATLTVGCKPAVLGPRSTQLTFMTDLPRQPQGSIPVRSFGGGPDIQVTPFPTMNFGKVAYFANANPPVFQKRKLAVMNVGTAPPAPDVTANLRLGRFDASGQFIPNTIFSLTPLNANTAADEFTVEVPASYDPNVGLEARVGKNLAELVVTLTPRSVGLKQAKITVYSNDPDEGAVEITVSAEASVSPPCNYTVTPTTLTFGLIQPPDFRDLGFTIKNNGINTGDVCQLSNLDLGAGTHAFFSLPNGPIAAKELAPGEVMQVVVRVWPQGSAPSGVTQINGTVEFYMSSPTRPRATVSLSAQIAPACLTIAPDDLDFGTVRVGCSSASRTFTVYNTCPTPVGINAFRILNAPTSDPRCLASAGCEFLLTSAPAVPAGGLQINPGDTPITFEVKYDPVDVGLDANAVAISATQNATNVMYVVGLKGRGDLQGLQTDAFMQNARPKADILLVVDNSGSMQDNQVSLATNFDSFIKYAQTAQVDYHLAVTTTDMTASGERGRFVSDPVTHPEKVLTPATIDVENKFKAKVNVGIQGSGIERGAEPALAALTPPLINSDNAGFLRDDAALAVVVVSDENDQSPADTAYYLNQFWNIKGHNRKTMFTFNAIAAFTQTCGAGVLDDGDYAFYTAQTNGVREEICTPDWAKALENLGKTAFGFRTRFFLTSQPDPTRGELEVRIDGQLVPATDARGTAIWTYDPATNSVNFAPLYVPEPGQNLTITYRVTCYP